MVTDDNGKFKRLYRKWSSMIRRCTDPKHPAYGYYGGRGITICERWLGKQGYVNFVADLGEPPEGLTLERVNNLMGYSPENCKWATWKEQAANKRKRQPIPGSLKSRAKLAGLPYSTVYQRVCWGWSIDRALTTPKRSPGRHPGERLGVPTRYRNPDREWKSVTERAISGF